MNLLFAPTSCMVLIMNLLENIFKRLYRVETSRNMKTGGHGLGLAIARELAHQLGGEITVTSQYGLGSTFTLLLNLSGNENKA